MLLLPLLFFLSVLLVTNDMPRISSNSLGQLKIGPIIFVAFTCNTVFVMAHGGRCLFSLSRDLRPEIQSESECLWWVNLLLQIFTPFIDRSWNHPSGPSTPNGAIPGKQLQFHFLYARYRFTELGTFIVVSTVWMRAIPASSQSSFLFK